MQSMKRSWAIKEKARLKLPVYWARAPEVHSVTAGEGMYLGNVWWAQWGGVAALHSTLRFYRRPQYHIVPRYLVLGCTVELR